MKKCAFLKITLDDLEEEINNGALIEEYQNGKNQFGKKPSASVQAYNQLFKTYTSAMMRLKNNLPSVGEKGKALHDVLCELIGNDLDAEDDNEIVN